MLKQNLRIEAQRELARCETWIRHAGEHPGFRDKPSAALWEALAAATEARDLLLTEYRLEKAAGR